jgi:hypothetical protein
MQESRVACSEKSTVITFLISMVLEEISTQRICSVILSSCNILKKKNIILKIGKTSLPMPKLSSH